MSNKSTGSNLKPQTANFPEMCKIMCKTRLFTSAHKCRKPTFLY